ncbi:response regulator [Actinoalloteichus hymeniacidonis]|uniref:Transcriptional regulatory protein n=1 Tax=Actinoalloteichus hymeniacidonis TaxID=340345 RepID=A0AAC9HRX5_9PSEU|nr:response regulator [Actinoalloteichus hymeniacidonis]AOS64253.1 response regulator of citrate/malate metabolism [Actinoalloteichus hymeniacidonis]MBB5907679.1 response regulator of citrate/malate metabolism [Actinoalloteichus hymeniacidonis]
MIRVLVVEDDPVAAAAHRTYVERVAGFTVAGVVHSGSAAIRFCERGEVDLVLLDFYLPDLHGLAVCRALRAAGSSVDVIAVTSARDLTVVRAAVSAGIVQYLLKPFTFASLRAKLERYRRFRDQVLRTGEVDDQAEIDGVLATLRTPDHGALPKGMTGHTLDLVSAALRAAGDGLSAAALAGEVGVSRVTARRYLEYLADNGLARRTPHYGQVGRPEVRYSAIR